MVSKLERETILRRDADGWHAWSCIPADIAKFKRQGWTLEREDRYGAQFTAPNHAVKIGPREKRQLSAAQLELSRSQAARMNSALKNAPTLGEFMGSTS